MKFVFFGTPDPAVEILEGLKNGGLLPSFIVTNPDKPQGRKHILTPTPVKVWAQKNNIPLSEPENISGAWDLFIVVAYGKILPKSILDIPKYGSINVHYSLLPKYRGASPIESQILADDKNTGVSIMLLDEKMDHGPILASAPVITAWPPKASDLRSASNKVASELLVKVIPDLLAGKITPQEQNHTEATYTKKFQTADGEIKLEDDPYKNFLKIQAFANWLPVFFFKDNKRIIVKEARFVNGKLEIMRVVPEGKKEMDWKVFNSNA